MKKLLLSVVAILLVTAVTFAQSNEAYVIQVGTTNTSTVDQSGTAGHNLAYVNQYGSNIANVQQLGVGSNSATINQGSNGLPVTNNHQAAYVGDWQDGAFIMQNGATNTAAITMTGNLSTGTINQVGSLNSGSQTIGTNYSEMSGHTSGVWMSQEGTSNYSTQITSPSFGSAGIKQMTVYQDGNSNIANQTSIGGYGSTLEATQLGNSNTSTQYQNQMGGIAHTYVDGDDNTTSQNQLYTVWALSGRNDAYIDIDGSSNTTIQSQTGQYNLSRTTQTGDGNYSMQTQTGDSHSSIVTQTGNNNISNVTQN
jgi:hypothetical protein